MTKREQLQCDLNAALRIRTLGDAITCAPSFFATVDTLITRLRKEVGEETRRERRDETLPKLVRAGKITMLLFRDHVKREGIPVPDNRDDDEGYLDEPRWLSGLVACLRHYCDSEGLSWNGILSDANTLYREEAGE